MMVPGAPPGVEAKDPPGPVPADDKTSARINCVSHLLSMVPYHDVPVPVVDLPPVRSAKDAHHQVHRPPPRSQTEVPDHAARLLRR